MRYRIRRALWERRPEVIDARYVARAERLPEARWDHPGLARLAAWHRTRRAEADALAVARDALVGRFAFLGRSELLGAEVDWFREDFDRGTRLWKTHLHEFSYAIDLARAAAETGNREFGDRAFALARSWRDASPIGCRDFAMDVWNGRAVATRILHWASAAAFHVEAGHPADDLRWLGRELGLHGLFLRDNLELDLRGNHLFRDAVGLVFAQELVGGVPDALDWLQEQVVEQVLPDGGHYERAPFYHAICTRDLFETKLLLGDAAPAWLDAALAAMAGFLEAVVLGDGEIPLQGDGWLGEAVPPLLTALRAQLSPQPPERPDRHSGLAPLTAGAWRLVARVGDHAPDEQMGHAHADLLSFDLSHRTTRVITDTGTLSYDPGPDRQRVRSTASHNTVGVDGVEQLELWGSFRVGRRSRARVRAHGISGTWSWLCASHDAYRHLPGGPVPYRLWALGPEGLVVLDWVAGQGRHRLESHLHEHPNASDASVQILPLDGDAEVSPAPLHERFGETQSMRRHRLVSETQLPWAGGWWVGAGPLNPRAGALTHSEGRVTLALETPPTHPQLGSPERRCAHLGLALPRVGRIC
ncbi:MAG: alginate lyase family protein [Myxococcota bacterium]